MNSHFKYDLIAGDDDTDTDTVAARQLIFGIDYWLVQCVILSLFARRSV